MALAAEPDDRRAVRESRSGDRRVVRGRLGLEVMAPGPVAASQPIAASADSGPDPVRIDRAFVVWQTRQRRTASGGDARTLISLGLLDRTGLAGGHVPAHGVGIMREPILERPILPVVADQGQAAVPGPEGIVNNRPEDPVRDAGL